MSSSFFSDVKPVEADETFQLLDKFQRDTNPNKVNLGIGVYRDDEGKPWVLPVVSSTEVALAADKTLNHEYLSIDGLKEFCTVATKLILGADSPALVQNRVCAVQALSGTGSLRLLLEFTKRFSPTMVVYTSEPSWGNHVKIVRDAGYSDRRKYRYFDKDTKGLDLNGMIEDLQNAPEGSILIIHGCAHNPTGVDPTKEQWEKIANVIKEKRLLPIMDYAYLGLVSGDPDTDAWPLRHFVKQGLEMGVAQSFAKNFGLYNERIGCAFFVTNDTRQVEPIRSQLKAIIRPMWSNPPAHGARIVTTILNNPALIAEWKECVQTISKRISSVRQLLFRKVREIGIPGNWQHIIEQCGMFTFTGLTAKQCKYILEKHHVYMLSNGRFNMCAITTKNVDYVAKAMDDAVRNVID